MSTTEAGAGMSVSDAGKEESAAMIDALNEQAWQMRTSDPEGAVELASRAGTLARQAGGYACGEGWSLLTIGICALHAGEYERAGRSLAAARELLDGCGEGAAHAARGLGVVHWFLGEFPQALEHFHASVDIFRQIDDRAGETAALGNIGSVYEALGNYPQALEYHRSGLEITREIGDRMGEANALGSIGSVHLALGEYPQALEHYQSGLAITRERGDRFNEAAGLGNIGVVFSRLGDYPQALEHHHASLRTFHEIGNRSGEASALVNIGTLHQVLGEHEQALEHYRAGLDICRQTGNRRVETSVLGGMGVTYLTLGEYSQALEHLRATLDICRQIGDRSGEAGALVEIASVYNAQGVFDNAVAALEAAAEIARQSGERALLGRAMLVLGRAHAGTDQPEAAIAVLEQAILVATELGEKPMEMEARELIARQYKAQADPGAALEHLERHIELKEEVLGEQTRRRVSSLQAAWQRDVEHREAEMERRRMVELKAAFDRLEQAHGELERTHRELKAAQSSLVQSEKMASLGQLTAGLAHEINNPINFITSSLPPLQRDIAQIRRTIEELGMHLPSDELAAFHREQETEEVFEEIGQLLRTIDTGAARTAGIVAGLRSFSRLDEGGLKRVDLHEGIDAAVTILSGSLGAGIELVREYGHLPAVECYPGEINQVFMNILNNAIRAIAGTGAITIRTEVVDGGVRVSIGDTGAGMTPDVQARIFEPFFTTRDVGEGKGLGLSIAWGIVEKHGGEIDVRSMPGEGSTFTVTLPVV